MARAVDAAIADAGYVELASGHVVSCRHSEDLACAVAEFVGDNAYADIAAGR